MNTNNLKTFEIIPFGAISSAVGAGYYPTVEPQIEVKPTFTTLPYMPDGKGLLDDDLVKSVQVVDTDTGFPLEKVNVYAKSNPSRGGSTDANGNITIVAQSPTEVIVFQYQDKKVERVFNTLGGLINIDTKLTQDPVNVTAGPATDSKVNWIKWGGIAIGAVVLLSLLSQDKPKKITV